MFKPGSHNYIMKFERLEPKYLGVHGLVHRIIDQSLFSGGGGGICKILPLTDNTQTIQIWQIL